MAVFALSILAFLPNPSFEEGEAGRPVGWRLAQGKGAWEKGGRTGRFCLSVEGEGRDSARWECGVPAIKPMRLYRLSFWARSEEGSAFAEGCVISGLSAERAYRDEVVVSGVNRDFLVGEEWSHCSFIFVAPPNLIKASVYLGQWHVKGKIYFDDVSLELVEPDVLERDGTKLGSEEGISEGVYSFDAHWGGPFSNWSSALFNFTAGFNTNRWILDRERFVIYRHSPGFPQESAKVKLTIWWYQHGLLAVEASRDGRNWTLAGRVKGDGEHEVSLPKVLFPAEEVFVRLRSEGLMQVTHYSYESLLFGSPPDVRGRVMLLVVERPAPSWLFVKPKVFPYLAESEVEVENRSGERRALRLRVEALFEGKRVTGPKPVDFFVGPHSRIVKRLERPRLAKWGEYKVKISLLEKGEEVYRASSDVFVPALQAFDYGRRLPFQPRLEGLVLWWCGPNEKVSRERVPPEGGEVPIWISAARNEFEPFQIVIRPKRDLMVEKVEAEPLLGPKGARIGSENIEFLKVEYVKVTRPTDEFGCVGLWPDPLPPIKGPFNCPANLNTPLWVRVYVPKGIPEGDYKGWVVLKIKGGPEVRVPLRLRVFEFTLTDETHTTTAYGVEVNWLFHGIKTPEEEAKVFDFYMQTFAKHRVSPYWPIPSMANPDWELEGPKEEIVTGPLRFVCDKFRGNFFSILKGEERVGRVGCCLTQFEREGVGWQGKGLSWPSPDFVREVNFVVKEEKRCVVQLTSVKASSSPAERMFEATYRFEFAPGRPWTIVNCLTIKNTDKVRWRLDGFFYLVPPGMGGYKAVNGRRYGAWLWPDKGLAFGGVALGEGISFGLWNGHGDIYRPVGRWLEPGEVYKDEGPPVVLFVGPARDEAGVKALAEGIAKEAEDFLEGELSLEGLLSYAHKEEATVKFENFAAFEEAMRRYFDGLKFNSWDVARLFKAGMVVRFYEGVTPELRRAYEEAYRRLEEHLRKQGWLDKAYFYWFDEPTEKDYPFVAEGMRLLHRLAPGVRRLLTEQPEPPLYGMVDIWVPVLDAFDPKRAKERQRQGEEVWWYVCCGPRAPYPNNFVDHPAICHRIRFWAAEKYGVQGSLYWSTTYWASKGKPRNPWDNPASYAPDGLFWGNGDGFLLYPPRSGEPPKEPVLEPPVDSQRWELIREGLEDREYFWLLRRLLQRARESLERTPEGSLARRMERAIREAESALLLPEKLVKSLTEWERDPERLMEARNELARAIEELSNLVRQ